MRYRCVKEFAVPLCDDDGRDEEEMMTIHAGEEFTYKGDAFVVSLDGVRLEADNYTWLEIPKDKLDECFVEV